MVKNLNRRGNSPKSLCQINPDYIIVWFKGNPKAYTYPVNLNGANI